MTNQEKKAYLQTYRRLTYRIKRREDEIETIRARLTRTTPTYSGMTFSGTLDPDKYSGGIDRMEQLKTQLSEEINDAVERRRIIVDSIEAMKNDRYSDLLYRRYINGQTWEKIGAELHMEIRWVYRCHGKALTAYQPPGCQPQSEEI